MSSTGGPAFIAVRPRAAAEHEVARWSDHEVDPGGEEFYIIVSAGKAGADGGPFVVKVEWTHDEDACVRAGPLPDGWELGRFVRPGNVTASLSTQLAPKCQCGAADCDVTKEALAGGARPALDVLVAYGGRASVTTAVEGGVASSEPVDYAEVTRMLREAADAEETPDSNADAV
jgi:hypothetical protein